MSTDIKTYGDREPNHDPNQRMSMTADSLALAKAYSACDAINETLDELEKWIRDGKKVADFIQAKRNGWPKFDTRN